MQNVVVPLFLFVEEITTTNPTSRPSKRTTPNTVNGWMTTLPWFLQSFGPGKDKDVIG